MIKIVKGVTGDYSLEKQTDRVEKNWNGMVDHFVVEEISDIDGLELYELCEDIMELLKDKYPKI